MGGIADYSGALVCNCRSGVLTTVSVQRRPTALSTFGVCAAARGRSSASMRIDSLTGRCATRLSGRMVRRARRGPMGGVRDRRRPTMSAARAQPRPRNAHQRRVQRARGKGRELLRGTRGRDDDGGGGGVRPRDRAARRGDRVPVGRESRRRRTVRHHGSDDERVRRTGSSSPTALPAGDDRGIRRGAGRLSLLWN